MEVPRKYHSWCSTVNNMYLARSNVQTPFLRCLRCWDLCCPFYHRRCRRRRRHVVYIILSVLAGSFILDRLPIHPLHHSLSSLLKSRSRAVVVSSEVGEQRISTLNSSSVDKILRRLVLGSRTRTDERFVLVGWFREQDPDQDQRFPVPSFRVRPPVSPCPQIPGFPGAAGRAS